MTILRLCCRCGDNLADVKGPESPEVTVAQWGPNFNLRLVGRPGVEILQYPHTEANPPYVTYTLRCVPRADQQRRRQENRGRRLRVAQINRELTKIEPRHPGLTSEQIRQLGGLPPKRHNRRSRACNAEWRITEMRLSAIWERMQARGDRRVVVTFGHDL